MPNSLFFLPGASGDLDFWTPVSGLLAHPGERRFVSWPGFGGVPADPRVHGIDDLVARLVRQFDGPCDLIAQSMGGVIALRAALAAPACVRHLVLTTTSGGVDTARLGASDWRRAFRAEHPDLPRWFEDELRDLSAELPHLQVPTLLLFGDADPISPVAVGRRLAELMPDAELVVFEGGTHDLARERAAEVAPHIARHLAR